MKSGRPALDLNTRYVKLIEELDAIRRAPVAADEPESARMVRALNAVIDFLNPTGADAQQGQRVRPLYGLIGKLVEERTAGADTKRKKETGGRPGVGVWETMTRAVAIAAVGMLEGQGRSRGDARKADARKADARKAGASLLRGLDYGQVSASQIKQWENDWLPRQAQPLEISDGHLPPEIIRQNARNKMDAEVRNGADPVAVARDRLKSALTSE